MRQPTHVVRMINNWDGEKDIVTVFAFKDDDQFFCFETGEVLLEFEGDEILKVWELS